MSSAALNWAKRVTVGDATRKSILLVLCDYADEQASCFPSQATIAAESEAAERTVRRVLAEFEAAGIIRRERRSGGHYGRGSDRIFLDLSWGSRTAAASQANDAHPATQPANVTGNESGPTGHGDRQVAISNRPLTTTQPAAHDRPSGHSLADEPPRTTKNRDSQSSSSLTRAAAISSDDGDDLIAAASRLAAIAALDDFQRDAADPANSHRLRPVPSHRVEGWLNSAAGNWRAHHAAAIDEVLAAWPGVTAEDLVAHCNRPPGDLARLVDGAGQLVKELPKRRECGRCHGTRIDFDDNGDVITCPDCNGTGALSAGNSEGAR
ncbi:MAG: helix-turn-helix domain-containing protein [Acidimicrobiales bacterium]|nr:helix-turn-helix domain-containing protein [Acidimicrobiales bacterium]